MPLDPAYFKAAYSDAYPPRPLSVIGFDTATGVFDFTAVPGFDLARLQSLWHVGSRRFLYARPINRGLDLAEVDGVAVPAPPTSGKVLKVRPNTASMSAADEVVAFYDRD